MHLSPTHLKGARFILVCSACGFFAGCGTSSNSAGGSRDPTQQPFSVTSVWNQPIGSGAQWSSSSDADTAQLIALQGSVEAAGFGKPFYSGAASDPVVNVTSANASYKLSAQSIHISVAPSSFKLWMTFFDATVPTQMWSYYNCSLVNGSSFSGGLSCSAGALVDLCGDGVTSVQGGGEFDYSIGTIRHWELAAGAIQHTLRYAVSLDTAKSAPTWNTGLPFPDDSEDFNGPTQYTGSLAFGSTIGIPSSVNLGNLGLSQGGLMLAQALQQHGAIMRDTTGGTTHLAFYAEPQDESDPLIKQMRSDQSKIIPYLRVMRNQSASTVNGGGTPSVAQVAPLLSSVCP